MRSMVGTTLSLTLGVNRFVAGATFRAIESFRLKMSSSSMVVLALLAISPSVASAQSHCSRETLVVRGTPVTVAYCVNGEAERGSANDVVLNVEGTFSASGQSFSRTGTMKFIAGDGPSRVLENVDLNQLGLQGTLHLTLLYTGREVRVESAMLTPGALTIK